MTPHKTFCRKHFLFCELLFAVALTIVVHALWKRSDTHTRYRENIRT